MKCLKGFSSSSSGMFSMERSTEEQRELFLEAEIFLVAIFSLFLASSNSLYKSIQLSASTRVPGEIGCGLNCQMDGMCGLYRAEVSKGAGAYLCTFQSNACADTQNAVNNFTNQYVFVVASYMPFFPGCNIIALTPVSVNERCLQNLSREYKLGFF